MHLARCRPTNHDRNIEVCPLHLTCHRHHLLEARRDETTESDDVSLQFDGLFHYLMCRHHDTEVDDIVIVAAHYHADDVLSDVVHVALDRSKEHPSSLRCASLLLRHDGGLQQCYGTFHCARRLHHLWEKHLSAAEAFAHGVHALHEWTFDDIYGMGETLKCLRDISLEPVGHALHHSLGDAVGHRPGAP